MNCCLFLYFLAILGFAFSSKLSTHYDLDVAGKINAFNISALDTNALQVVEADFVHSIGTLQATNLKVKTLHVETILFPKDLNFEADLFIEKDIVNIFANSFLQTDVKLSTWELIFQQNNDPEQDYMWNNAVTQKSFGKVGKSSNGCEIGLNIELPKSNMLVRASFVFDLYNLKDGQNVQLYANNVLVWYTYAIGSEASMLGGSKIGQLEEIIFTQEEKKMELKWLLNTDDNNSACANFSISNTKIIGKQELKK